MRKFKTKNLSLYLSAFFLVGLIVFAVFRDTSTSITLRDAQQILDDKLVEKVVVTKEYVYLKTKDDLFKIASSQVTPKMFIDYKVEVDDGGNFFVYILVFVVFLGVGSLVFRWYQKQKPKKEESLHVDGSKNEQDSVIQPIKTDVSFEDIGGIEDVKVELEEIIDFMKNPKRYKNFGARMPRGVLLVGPPGVGKTMIAKAVANEANVSFYYQSGASFVQIYVGMGAKRVHDLFSVAKKNAPAIIFIDEIDAIGKTRDGQRNDEREATLNQLLTEMDGFESSSGVIVVAATNKIDVLDSALLRAGRFDRRVFVELPTKSERVSILEKYLKNIPHSLDVEVVASMCVGFNGASLSSLVNEAALLALRQKDEKLTLEHFNKVKDKVMFGKKKLQVLNDKQKEYQVTYQAGKVVCATHYDLPFEKLMLSSEKLIPSTDDTLIKSEIESLIKVYLSGVVACDIKYKEHTSNAKNDIKEAKILVKQMVDEYGMGSSLCGSEDDEKKLIDSLYSQTQELLQDMSKVIVAVEKRLYENESITKQEVKELIDDVL